MKKQSAIFAFLLLLLGLCAAPSLRPVFGTVKGVCKDADGKPLVDAVVVYANQDNGQKYTLTTKKKGDYFSLGIAPGNYTVTLYKNADDVKANKPLDKVNKYPVSLDENTLDFDLKKEQQKARPRRRALLPNRPSKGGVGEKAKKENITIKALNEKIVAANASMPRLETSTPRSPP